MSDVDKFLRWGALGAFSTGSLLYLLAVAESSEANRLARLPVIQSLKDLRALEQRRLKPGTAVAARGTVSCPETLSDTLSQRKSVVAWVTGEQLCRKWSENSKWETETKKIKLLKRVCPLFLNLADNVRLHLRQPSDKDVEPVLEHAVSIPHSPRSNLIQQAVEATLGYMTAGYIEHEYILPEGTEITAVGGLAYPSQEGKGEFGLEPLGGRLVLSRRTISEQIRHVERWSKGLKWTAAGFGLCGAVLAGIYFFRLGRTSLAQRQQRKQEERFLREARLRREAATERRQQASDGGAALSSPPEQPARASEADSWQCVVCYETNGPQTVFPACGHVAACQSCAAHLLHCPICRTKSRPTRLFYS